jgi:hypothetical protein
MSSDNANTTSNISSSDAARAIQELLEKIVPSSSSLSREEGYGGATVFNEDKLKIIGKITFGSNVGKQAVANHPLLIPLMIAYHATSPSMEFVKTIRACVVNCAPARVKCREKRLYETMVVKQLLVHDHDHDHDHQGEDPNEIITTLCALCMNDDENTNLLKEVLTETKTTLKDFAAPENVELCQRVTFLEALMESSS